MLDGANVRLRARLDTDVAVLDDQLYNDLETRVRADNRPWAPRAPGSLGSPYAISELSPIAALFSVVSVADSDTLAGEALLWGIDTHNRSAHVGVALVPKCRGRGMGTEVLELLCRFAFKIRGLHRLQLETAFDNVAMVRAAEKIGFSREGTLRGASWALGVFVDQAVFGLLEFEWSARQLAPARTPK